MKSNISRVSSVASFLCLSLLAFSLTSCEDKALVQKNEDLRAQVSDLEKQIATAEVMAGEDPGDQSESIEKSNKELADTLKKLEELDSERQKLTKQLAEKEKEVEAYKKKYPVGE